MQLSHSSVRSGAPKEQTTGKTVATFRERVFNFLYFIPKLSSMAFRFLSSESISLLGIALMTYFIFFDIFPSFWSPIWPPVD